MKRLSYMEDARCLKVKRTEQRQLILLSTRQPLTFETVLMFFAGFLGISGIISSSLKLTVRTTAQSFIQFVSSG